MSSNNKDPNHIWIQHPDEAPLDPRIAAGELALKRAKQRTVEIQQSKGDRAHLRDIASWSMNEIDAALDAYERAVASAPVAKLAEQQAELLCQHPNSRRLRDRNENGTDWYYCPQCGALRNSRLNSPWEFPTNYY